MKNILVAIDGSRASLQALRRAISIAQAFGARLTIVEVIGPLPSLPGYEGPLPPPGERTEWFAEERFREARSVLEGSGARWDRIVCEGASPADEICSVAEEGDYDLVAVGAHDHSAFMRWLTRSVSDQVAHRAPCAVLVVREDVTIESPGGPGAPEGSPPGKLGRPSELSDVPRPRPGEFGNRAGA
jgi:nucleotide-binding universal stress UspA family protein